MKPIYTTLVLLILGITGLQAQEFVNPLLIPPIINDDNYHLNVIETEHNFNPNGSDSLNAMVKTFAFEDANNPGTTTILGPTLTWGYLNDLTPTVTNNLSEVTTCHWHGAHVPQFADGSPHQRIQPGDTWNPFFKALDKSATMWYHPHAMGLTYRHVQIDVNPRPLFNIDSTLMDMMVVNDVIKVDSTELWTIHNNTDRGHPWHIHDTHFWVTEIIDAEGSPVNETDHPEIFMGPKDNVLVQPGWKLTYIASFPDYDTQVAPDSSYMYLCHILPHEDNGMMGQFVVWNGIGNGWSTSVRDNELSTIRMDVFPNPANEVLYLDGTTTRESTLKFIDMNGRLVKELLLPAFDGAIDLSSDGLPPGMLIMDWQTHEGRGVSRIVIRR